MGRIIFISVSVAACLAISAEASIINIPQDYSTIQAGIDASVNGDTVLVAPGTYHERINFNVHNITVGSLFLTTGDTAYIGNTVIDGDSLGTVVTFENGEDTTATICGFTIQDGYGRSHYGGGGILCLNSGATITHNIIKGNSAQWGGGISVQHSTARIAFCLIYDNYGSDGSGIDSDYSRTTISNCTISRNRGGSIHAFQGYVKIINTIIWGNRYEGINDNSSPDSVEVTNCVLDAPHEGEGNIVDNPLFIDAAHDNYNVCSLSPCIDAGDPDILDPDGTRADIGYFYPTHTACPNNDTWFVETAGSDSTGDGSPQNPFGTIQHAIDMALQGDTVIVGPGTYRENIGMSTENLVLASQWIYSGDTTDITGTIIDGRDRGSVVTLSLCDSTSSLIGFTIQNGYAFEGGGIYSVHCDTKIEHNIIWHNHAQALGGGLLLHGFNSRLEHNFIAYDSTSYSGGGVYMSDSQPKVRGNVIYRNWAEDHGGGMFFGNWCHLAVNNNVIVQNVAGNSGAGIHCEASDGFIDFNVIYGNRTGQKGAGIYFQSCDPPLTGNIIYGNLGGSGLAQIDTDAYSDPSFAYCNIQGGWPGEGNIDVNPNFRSLTYVDYRLQSTACGNSYQSPCIDAGPPDIADAELGCWAGLGGARSDMGAFGGGDNLTGIEGDEPKPMPEAFVLSQNYPNPFNARTVIKYFLSKPSKVEISIYDILGRKIWSLSPGLQTDGGHGITWDAEGLPSGILIYRINAGDFQGTKKMTLLK